MISLQNIHKSYITGSNRLHVLKGINLKIEKGEFVSIMGSSGSGKSTLLNVMGLLDRYDEGTYHLNGFDTRSLTETRAAKLRNQHIGFVFQSFNLITFKTALENVALPLYYQGVKRKRRNMMAMELLEKFGLKDWCNHLPSELSGGQKQRVAIARALITRPSVILADEPTGALDTQNSYEVMQLLKQLNNEGLTIVVVTHEHDIAGMTKRKIRIKDGIIVNE